MNRLELDKFLREHSELEKALLKNSFDILNTDLSGLSLDQFESVKLPATGEYVLEKYKKLEEATTLEDKLFIPQDENIVFFTHPRFSDTPIHKHSFIEMVYVYSGTCSQIINNSRITMDKGDLCILDTNTYHRIERVGENDIIVNCLMKKNYFDTAFLSRLSGNDILSSFFIHAIYQSKSFNDYILFRSAKEGNIHEIIENILCEYIDKKTCFAEVINSYMVILFSELLRSYKKSMNRENYEALNNTMISDIILYIQRNYKSCTLVSTAEHFNFHPIYLSKILKKFSNFTFTSLKNEARLKRACILLENTTVKIEEIANDIGYSNIHFFYKIFRDKYGVTPAGYRRSHNEKNG